jgi:CRP/FNR family cyclic AMP-dependent transcriptional regulator
MASIVPSSPSTRTEDVLAYLPISATSEYAKGQTIYSPSRLSKNIYLVVSGKVGTSQIVENGHEVLLDIVGPEELFGESAFLNVPHRPERATVIENATLMTWAISDLEDLVVERPRLAIALLQVLAQRNADLVRRVESFSTDTIEQRLARSLVRFSERLGTPEEDGTIRMMPLTHEMLSRHVGTSREIVTQYMIKFRRQGHVAYSRQAIRLHRDSLRTPYSIEAIYLRSEK